MENWEGVGLILRDYMEWYSRERGEICYNTVFPKFERSQYPQLAAHISL